MSQLNPFDYLLQMAESVHRLNPQLPDEEEIIASWSGIGFNVLGQRMVAPLGEVVEMLPTPSVTRLPGVQTWVLGLANVRGRLLPLFDLEAFLGGKLSNNRSRHRVLILEMGELLAGLVVSEAYGMQHFPEDLSQCDLPEAVSHIAPYTKGAYDYNGNVWISFSPFSLISDPRFFNASAA